MRPSRLAVAVAALVLSACTTTTSAVCGQCRGAAVYPPYKGKAPKVFKPADHLPTDPGPGFLYTRVVYWQDDDAAFAYIVHVAEPGTTFLAIVGPLRTSDDYKSFSKELCTAYGRHGPGRGSCCPETKGAGAGGGGAGASSDDDRTKKLALTPMPPPPPPPPWDGSAITFRVQSGTLNSTDATVLGDAAGAAGTAYSALNGG